uniref:Uncharacterized protein n=1 Tax=Anguilla anguilla TaxID=7936 RepID=A0A0E9Q792_ANGAN
MVSETEKLQQTKQSPHKSFRFSRSVLHCFHSRVQTQQCLKTRKKQKTRSIQCKC